MFSKDKGFPASVCYAAFGALCGHVARPGPGRCKRSVAPDEAQPDTLRVDPHDFHFQFRRGDRQVLHLATDDHPGAQLGQLGMFDVDAAIREIAGVREHGMAAMAEGILPRWFGPKMLADNKAFLWHTLLARTCQEGYIATCAAIAGTDISDRLGEITQPTLVLGGKYDLATPPEAVEALAVNLPCARLEMFEDTGHLPAIEAPGAFAEALTKFVERISA